MSPVAQATPVLNLPPAPIVDSITSLSDDEKARYGEREPRRILALPSEEERVEAFEYQTAPET